MQFLFRILARISCFCGRVGEADPKVVAEASLLAAAMLSNAVESTLFILSGVIFYDEELIRAAGIMLILAAPMVSLSLAASRRPSHAAHRIAGDAPPLLFKPQVELPLTSIIPASSIRSL